MSAIKKLVEWGKLRTDRLDSELLLAHVLATNRLQIIVRGDDVVPDKEAAQFQELIKRRESGEPVAYLTGMKEFFGHEFEVNSHVLIPRPDTEKLLELALEFLPPDRSCRVIDLCTGSGCIGISIALARPLASLIATDVSTDALAMARQNANRHNVADRIEFRQGSWCEPVKDEHEIDLIVANPPYVKRSAMATLAIDVVGFEPHLALFGEGESGLEGHFTIMAQAPHILKKTGALMMEIGYDQGPALTQGGSLSPQRRLGSSCALDSSLRWNDNGRCEVFKDDAGNDRVVVIKNG